MSSVFYGTPDQLSTHYKDIDKEYPVIIGEEFWYRLTGHQNFYQELGEAMGEIAAEYDSSELIHSVIKELTKEIENKML